MPAAIQTPTAKDVIAAELEYGFRNDARVVVGTKIIGTPVGGATVYVGRSAPWKGLKQEDFWKEAEKHVGKKGVGLANALRKAIDISKKCANVKGKVVYGGRIMSKKVLCQMALAGKISEEEAKKLGIKI